MNDPVKQFEAECIAEIEAQGKDKELKLLSKTWQEKTTPYKYSYHFTWMGRPIIQMPTDIIAMQEIIWKVKPNIIVETGIAHGGSAIFYASMLELLNGNGIVVSVDIDIRKHNREAIEHHPMYNRIHMIEGSSTDDTVVEKVKSYIKPDDCVLVALDSCHSHSHVLRELELYSPLVTEGSYLVCSDTIVEWDDASPQGMRPWGKGDNPMTAVWEWLKTKQGKRFTIDTGIDDKVLISTNPNGYLRCIK